MKTGKKLISTSIIFICIIVCFSCSTKKNTLVRRSFHNLTSHYNGYWNAKENFKNTVKDMTSKGNDNFSSIIPVVYYGNKQEAQGMKSSLDNSIEKSFLMIRRHSMTFEGEEKIKWIDDCYLVIGMCYFYEKDYNNARRIFQYIIKNYPNRNSFHQAEMWLAKTYIFSNEFEKAQLLLESLDKSVKKYEVSRTIQKQLPIAFSEFYLNQRKYNEAIHFLEESLQQNKRNRVLTQRINYILGQIYQEGGKYLLASKKFKKSSKGSDFQINFNSKIRMAQCSDPKDGSYVAKVLNKMLKEDKNKEFRDQIYFALADIAERKGNIKQQEEYLTYCVSSSVKNNYQKALGAYKLADLYFNHKEYIKSQPYYDTTVQFLPSDYIDYVPIKEKTIILTELVSCLTTVQKEDSLQKVAKMDEPSRNALIKGIIADLREKERTQKEIEMQQQRNYGTALMNQYQDQSIQNKLGQKTGWYFYNSQMVANGVNDFKMRWGNRKQEDLWFLKNKQSVSWDSMQDIDQEAEQDTIQYVTDVMNEKYYLQYLPLTEEKIRLSDEKIEKSLFDAGFIASEKLNDYDLSNECFEKLITRFPKSTHLLLSYYMKYMNYTEAGNNSAAEDTKQQIIKLFPDSDYTKLFQDPTYLAKLQEKASAAKNLYNDAFSSYQRGQFDLVKMYAGEGIELNDPKFNPQFKYLSALSSFAKNKDTTEFVSKLKEISINYAGSDIATLSNDMINYYQSDTKKELIEENSLTPEEVAVKEKFDKDLSEFKYKCNSTYFYVLILDNKKCNIKATTTRVSDYLAKHNKLDALKQNSTVLNSQYEMISIISFPDCMKALDFYEQAILNKYIFSGLPADAYFHFVISQDNYPIFYRNKNIDAYIYFFNTKLLSQLE